MVLDRGPQFAAELTKELNRMLGIKTKLLTSFHPQTDEQTEQMNLELEQYLRFFIDNRQKDWLEWLTSVEFAINNKTHSATKVSLFIANYGRELRRGQIRKGEESNRVCRENKKGVRRSRGSIKEDTREDETTSR